MKKGLKSTHGKKTASKKHSESSFIKGLHVSRQDTLKTESQATVYSQRTHRTSRTLASQDFDIGDEDFDKDEMREVFVSEEEEKVIHKILQIARKGKINQKNAFEIPIKLADNDNSNITQTKFWKFASELLSASINIFDKRIENTWTNTNLIHDKLVRLHLQQNVRKMNQEEESQNQNNTNTARRDDILLLPIEELRDPRILQNARIGEQTLEEVSKLDNVRLKMQMLSDPLFSQKLKAFDNTSLKGLLLNIFSVGSSCQVELFTSNYKNQPKWNHDIPLKNEESQFVQDALRNTSKNQQINIFKEINSYKSNLHERNKVKGEKDAQQEGQTVDPPEDCLLQFQTFLGVDLGNFPDQAHEIGIFSQNQDNFQNEGNQNLQSQGKFSCFSQQETTSLNKFTDDFFLSSYNSELEKSFHSVMTPWQMQFKQGKLQKKKITRKKNTNASKKTIKEKIQPGQVNFDHLLPQSKASVLKKEKDLVSKSKSKSKKKKKTKTKTNLIPQQLIVYQKMNFRKIRANIHQTYINLQEKIDIPDFLAQPPMMERLDENTAAKKDIDFGITNAETNLDIFTGPSDQGQFLSLETQSQRKNYSLQRNIRQVKKDIYEQIKQMRELSISQLDGNISPASALITFLHLANEKNLVLRDNNEEDDVILSWE